MAYTTQTNTSKTTIIAIVIAVFAVAYGIGQHRTADMTAYAAANHCTWHDNGTMYGDDRDFTCK